MTAEHLVPDRLVSDPAPSLLCRVTGHSWRPVAVDGDYRTIRHLRTPVRTLELCRRCPASRWTYGDRIHA